MIALETKLAQAHWPPEQRRDVKATNNPMDRAGLSRGDPAFDWQAVLEPCGLRRHRARRRARGLRDQGRRRLLDTEPVATWKDYLAFHLADDAAHVAPEGLRRRAASPSAARPARRAEGSVNAGSAASRCSTT